MKVRKRLIEQRRAQREGRRFAAFYRGAKSHAAGTQENPFPLGSEEAGCWAAGWKYAQSQETDDAGKNDLLPVCRFGPGGDFVRDLPEGQS